MVHLKTDGSGEYAPADYTLTTSTIASVSSDTSTPFSYSASVVYTSAEIYPNEPASNAFNGGGSQWSIRPDAPTTNFNASFELGATVESPVIQVNGSNLGLAGGEWPSVWANDDPSQIFTFNAISQNLVCNFSGPVSKINIGGYNTITTQDTGTYFTIFKFIMNGEELVDDTSVFAINPVLTFATPNPDLQYFQVGDVLQPEVKAWSDYVTPVASISPDYPAPNLFNGSTSLSYTSGCTAVAGGSVITWQPDTPIANVETLEIGGYLAKVEDVVLNVNGIDVTEANGTDASQITLKLPKITYFS